MKTGCSCTQPCGMDGECEVDKKKIYTYEDIKDAWMDGLNEGLERSLAHEWGTYRKNITFYEWFKIPKI